MSLIPALLYLSSPCRLKRPHNTFDASVMYTELHANAPVGGCGCFWMQGGSGEIAVTLWRNFSGVARSTANTPITSADVNVGLSLLTGLGGLRMRIPNRTRFQPCGEALFGGVHGFDSYFISSVISQRAR